LCFRIEFLSEKNDERIRNGVINPRDPKENGTTGGTGPLNMDAACKFKKSDISTYNLSAAINNQN
jgi:hypothetical protein